jgi:hypothetical protein
MKTLYCLRCGQEWKGDGLTPTFHYVRNWQYWSELIEKEARELCKGNESIRFKVIHEVTDWKREGNFRHRTSGPRIDSSSDPDSLKCLVKAIRKHIPSMPKVERDFFSGLASSFEERAQGAAETKN